MLRTLKTGSTRQFKVFTRKVNAVCSCKCSNDAGFPRSPNNRWIIQVNPFTIDFNSRRTQIKLYGELQEAELNHVEEKATIQALIIDYLDKLSQNVPYEMISYELDLDSMKLFKMLNIRIEPQCESLLEKMVEYTKVLSRLLMKKLLVLVTICNYLDADEVNALYEICNYQKLKVLFLECHEQCFSFPVNTYIIDKDKCMIRR